MASEVEMLMQVLEAHIRGIRTELKTLQESHENSHVETMDMFRRAFPDGDLAGHQRFHQQLMDDAKTRRDIRNEVLKKLAAGSAWSAVVFFGYRAIDLLKDHVNVFTK